ncbi:myeloid leukemia factor isoform X2 [Palaemon carinicauda]|uniref:myeloid leukemia factor isoform X2 n=1 Tax=Palaemon carinicauda TaxID=392227 RepID=UPI0035B5900B
MSLFGSLMAGFDDDPFFGSHRSMMNQMDQMMNSMMNPFEGSPFFPPSPFPALTQGRRQQPRAGRPRDPFSALAIPSMGGLMSSMDQMARQGDCHTFSSSSVMTMTTGPDGRPTVYQASTSSRGAPGGVRETRRTVHDGHSGLRKMAIGHHIGDRSHIIEREQKDGNLEERQELVNLDEEEAPQFDQEFRRRTQGIDSHSLEYRPRHRPSPSSHRPRSSNLPALTSSSDDQRRREREERRQRFKQV